MKRSQFNMRVKPEFMEEIENWRAKQRPIPSASEAIVTLCMRAIRAESECAQIRQNDVEKLDRKRPQ